MSGRGSLSRPLILIDVSTVNQVCLLADTMRPSLGFFQQAGTLIVELPDEPLDSIATVLRLEIENGI